MNYEILIEELVMMEGNFLKMLFQENSNLTF